MNEKRLRGPLLILTIAGTLAAGCSSQPAANVPDPTTVEIVTTAPTGCADVIDVVPTTESSGTYRFDVTVRSADTGWDKYADLWEVRAPDGSVLGQRVLAHPHVEEQPFTRSQSGIEIPAAIDIVTVVARDTVAGFCGETLEISLP